MNVHKDDVEKTSYLNLVIVADARKPETLQHIDLICKEKCGETTRRLKRETAENKDVTKE